MSQGFFSSFYGIGSPVLSDDCSSFTLVVSLEAYFLGKLGGKKKRHEPIVQREEEEAFSTNPETLRG